jgi:hypothetical protein
MVGKFGRTVQQLFVGLCDVSKIQCCRIRNTLTVTVTFFAGLLLDHLFGRFIVHPSQFGDGGLVRPIKSKQSLGINGRNIYDTDKDIGAASRTHEALNSIK